MQGCEAKARRYKPSLRKRCELTAADILDIVAYWKAHEPSMHELVHQFAITRVLGYTIIRSYKKDPFYVARIRAKE